MTHYNCMRVYALILFAVMFLAMFVIITIHILSIILICALYIYCFMLWNILVSI